MEDVITIGVDFAKSVFQVHGVDADGRVVVRRQLRRRQMLPFFEKLPSCLAGWRRARRRITGGGRSSGLATGCG